MFVFDFCLTRQWGNDEQPASRASGTSPLHSSATPNSDVHSNSPFTAQELQVTLLKAPGLVGRFVAT